MSLDLSLVGRQIKNDNLISYLKKTILSLWKCRKDIYPSSVPVLLNREDIHKLIDYEYFVTSYLKEKHILLFFFTDLFNNRMAVICDKLFNFYKIRIECIADVYNNTLFSCQIKQSDGKYFIFMNDCVCIHGDNIKNMAFEYRYTAIDNFINTNVLSFDTDFILKQKICYKFKNIYDFITEISTYNLDQSDGILFIPNKLPLMSGTQKSNMYWIKNNTHTIDLIAKENEDGTILLECYNMKKKMDYAKIISSDIINEIKALEHYKSGAIIEFTIVGTTLKPTMVKLDKLFPNGLRVIEAVLYTINQNIQLDELKDII